MLTFGAEGVARLYSLLDDLPSFYSDDPTSALVPGNSVDVILFLGPVGGGRHLSSCSDWPVTSGVGVAIHHLSVGSGDGVGVVRGSYVGVGVVVVSGISSGGVVPDDSGGAGISRNLQLLLGLADLGADGLWELAGG